MILRRIATAIAKQDWFVVIIELAVVIVGILIGLQVAQWDDGRRERIAERHYLTRLHGDIQAMIEWQIAEREWYTDHRQKVATGLNALQACQLPDADRETFEFMLATHQNIAQLNVNRATYDEMISSGALSRLGNEFLKQQIASTYAIAEQIQNRIDYFSSDIGRAGNIIWRYVSFSISPTEEFSISWREHLGLQGPYGTSVSYDFDALCKNSEFRNAIVEIYDSVDDRLLFTSYFEEALNELSSLLEVEIEPAP